MILDKQFMDGLVKSIGRYTCTKADKNVIKQVKRIIKKYKYIEVTTHYYDGNSVHETWIDVEGIGYGWIWAKNWLTEHSFLLQRYYVKKFALGLLNTDSYVYQVKNEKGHVFVIVDYKNNYYDRISLSDKELEWW